jgi:3-oxoadipate enol-lactonase
VSAPTVTATSGGTGDRLLILGPSLGTAAPLWDAAAELLAPHFSTLSWDLPGHGLSQPATGPFTLGELADAVLRLADEQEAATFDYAGVSLSGAVGVELALRHPDRLSSLTTICSVPRFGEPANWHERAALVRAQSTAALVAPSASRWFAPGFIERDPRASSALLHVLSQTDDESYALCCEVLADYDARAELANIRIPFLALSGEYDGVATPDAVAGFAEAVPGGRAVEIPGAGHLAPIEQPLRVADTLREFLTRAT